MAVDISEPFISPRISFSYDLNNQSSDTTTATATTTTTANTVTTTFEFCITLNLLQQITSADELFYDGVLLPIQIKKPETLNPQPKSEVPEIEVVDVHRKRLKELLSDNDEEHKQEKSSSRSIWKFARSTSLNVDNGRGSKRLFRSLSLKRLLRSNSTDSSMNPTENEAPAIKEKLISGKESAMLQRCSSSIPTAPVHYSCRADHSCRRSVKKKNSGEGIKINPILNIPPTYDKNLFGSGSLFCKPKSKSK